MDDAIAGNAKGRREELLREKARGAYDRAAGIIAQADRVQLLEQGKGREGTRSHAGCAPAKEDGLSELVALHAKLVRRLHPCLGPIDSGVRWQYVLARLALKRRDLPMMESLDVLTRQLDSWDPLAHMGERELAAELALAEALVEVERERLRSLRGGGAIAA